MSNIKRDPRRLFTASQRNQIAAKQKQACGVCTEELGAGFHVHHVTPWALGGQTEVENGLAVCPPCHAVAPATSLKAFIPRKWQTAAMAKVLPRLRENQFATVVAAPGGGKTLFATATYASLRDTGDVARTVVFVPNRNLRQQWSEEARALNVFLRADELREHDRQDGVVLTYQALSNPKTVEQLLEDAEETPTLFILDEVHHLAKDIVEGSSSWALGVHRLVGDFRHPLRPALNLSGTLFRSKPSERVATINYRTRTDGKIETDVDYSITAGELQTEGQLRNLKVLGYGAEGLTAISVDPTGDSVDLDDTSSLDVVRGMVRDEKFIAGMVAETISRMAHASQYLSGAAPVKALIVADGITHAQKVHEVLVDQFGAKNSFVATGPGKFADDQITAFRQSKGQAVMVAVQKVTEGFDAPDIAVVAYMRSWRAAMFVTQMVGRAMRVSARERQVGRLLPATILIPDNEQLKDAFTDVLSAMKLLEPDPCVRCGQPVCTCPPIPRREKPPVVNRRCADCGQAVASCTCECTSCELSPATGCICQKGPQVDVQLSGGVGVQWAQVQQDNDFIDVDLALMGLLESRYVASRLPKVFYEEFTGVVSAALESDPAFRAAAFMKEGSK